MKDLLSRYGYTFSGNCNCDGFATEKYINDEIQLRIRTKKDVFKMRRYGRSITQWIPINLLQQTLSNIHATVQA